MKAKARCFKNISEVNRVPTECVNALISQALALIGKRVYDRLS